MTDAERLELGDLRLVAARAADVMEMIYPPDVWLPDWNPPRSLGNGERAVKRLNAALAAAAGTFPRGGLPRTTAAQLADGGADATEAPPAELLKSEPVSASAALGEEPRCHCGSDRCEGTHIISPGLDSARHDAYQAGYARGRADAAVPLVTAAAASPLEAPRRPPCDMFPDNRAASEVEPAMGLSAWPLDTVLERLADAADHLRSGHGCDAHGHEGVLYAAQAARAHVRALRAAPSAPESDARARIEACERACDMPLEHIPVTLDAHRNTAQADHEDAERARAEAKSCLNGQLQLQDALMHLHGVNDAHCRDLRARSERVEALEGAIRRWIAAQEAFAKYAEKHPGEDWAPAEFYAEDHAAAEGLARALSGGASSAEGR
jgi:hypothetical protein